MPDDLVVDPAYLARRLSIEEPDDDLLWRLGEIVREEQATVEAYLHRSVVVAQYVETGRWPEAPPCWTALTLGEQWNLLRPDVQTVVSSVAETDPDTARPTGLYTVTYTAGLPVATDPAYAPIRRRIVAAALASPETLREARAAGGGWARAVKSVSVGGDAQSVTYDADTPAAGSKGDSPPGAVPPLSTLDYWVLPTASVYQSRQPAPEQWPYAPMTTWRGW